MKTIEVCETYFSQETQSCVRLERQEDGEWCHTSGFSTQEEAKYKVPIYKSDDIPEWLK